MIKVFEDFDFSRVGQMQSLLEAHGIKTFIRNEYGSSVVGELPFVEVVPQFLDPLGFAFFPAPAGGLGLFALPSAARRETECIEMRSRLQCHHAKLRLAGPMFTS